MTSQIGDLVEKISKTEQSVQHRCGIGAMAPIIAAARAAKSKQASGDKKDDKEVKNEETPLSKAVKDRCVLSRLPSKDSANSKAFTAPKSRSKLRMVSSALSSRTPSSTVVGSPKREATPMDSTFPPSPSDCTKTPRFALVSRFLRSRIAVLPRAALLLSLFPCFLSLSSSAALYTDTLSEMFRCLAEQGEWERRSREPRGGGSLARRFALEAADTASE